MNFNEYIERRSSLEELDLSNLSKTRYEDKNSDYEKLKAISDDYKTQVENIGIFKYLIPISPILIAIFIFIFLADSSTKQINIMYFLLFFVLFPFLLTFVSFFNLRNKRCFSFFIGKVFPKYLNDVEREGLKIASCFYLQLSSIIYSSISIICLLLTTALDNYKFYLATTWLSSNIFSSIIDIFSFPLAFINPSIIPSSELISQSYNIPISNSLWLWFLISCVIIWTIVPRCVLLIIRYIASRNQLKKSFLESDKSKRVLRQLNPVSSTTSENTKVYEVVSSSKNDETIIHSEVEDISYSKILLFQLNENAINVIKSSDIYKSSDIVVYNRKLNYEEFHSKILILIYYKNAPKTVASNMMFKLTHCSISLGFVDENGKRVISDPNINEWKRFLKNKNIKFEVENGK